MEVGFNNDTAYFKITSDDLGDITKTIEQDVISFNVSEELKKIRTGSLTLRDPSGQYSRVFRNGRKFDLEWGYRTPFGFGLLSPNYPIARKGSTCIIEQPSGAGDESGQTTLNIQFFATEVLKGKEYRVYAGEAGTPLNVGDVVSTSFDLLGITNKKISFGRQSESVSKENSLRQSSSTYAFLFDLSQKYRCFFQIGENKTGQKIGLFVEYNKANSAEIKSFLAEVVGAVNVNAKELYYNSGDKSNVKSFSWQHNVGEGGGDEVQLIQKGGETVMVHRQAETLTVQYYKLNEKRLENAIAEKKDITSKTQFLQWALDVSDFKQIEKFFDPVQTATAPQSMGFTANCSMVGDPMLTPCMRVLFKDGFPQPLTVNQGVTGLTDFVIRRAVHNITKGSYTTEIEIADLYTVNGSLVQEIGDVAHWQNG